MSLTSTHPNGDSTQHDRVRSLAETATLANISLSTLRRRIAEGTGPRITRVSTRRVGVRDSDREQWLDRCAANS